MKLQTKDSINETVLFINELLCQHQEFFEAMHSNVLYHDLHQNYMEFIGKDSKEAFMKRKATERNIKKQTEDKKKKMQQRKELALLKISEKRAKFIEKSGIDTETSSNNDSVSNISEQDLIDHPKCQQCFEELISEDFVNKPFGYLCSVLKTKLLHDSLSQTFAKQKDLDKSLNEKEEYAGNIDKLEFDENFSKQFKFLNSRLSGLVVKTCRHMVHYDCLNNYKVQNVKSRARMMLIEDFNINEFACPL